MSNERVAEVMEIIRKDFPRVAKFMTESGRWEWINGTLHVLNFAKITKAYVSAASKEVDNRIIAEALVEDVRYGYSNYINHIESEEAEK